VLHAVLAWGNSVPDLINNMAMARDGFPSMAVAACFASPLFTLLIGMGVALAYGERGVGGAGGVRAGLTACGSVQAQAQPPVHSARVHMLMLSSCPCCCCCCAARVWTPRQARCCTAARCPSPLTARCS
jgi:Ca2+/Na+ antiporter